MRNKIVSGFFWLFLLVFSTPAMASGVGEGGTVFADIDLSQYVYSYGTVLKISDQEIILQEYDYDSDVEKEVVYKIIAETKFEGFNSVNELAIEDVVEVYYNEENGQRVAKIIHRELIDDENMANGY